MNSSSDVASVTFSNYRRGSKMMGGVNNFCYIPAICKKNNLSDMKALLLKDDLNSLLT